MSASLPTRPLGVAAERGGEGESVASVSDYFVLLKPRVMSLAIFTAFAGMVAAPVSVHPLLAFAALLCVAMGAGASGALNMWWDADIDRKMMRTRSRPVPAGRLEAADAGSFGAILGVMSVAMLGLFGNLLSAGLLALAILWYLLVYTVWLKRRSSRNIVVGGAAGAVPPMIGWAIATDSLGVEPLLMFLVIFLWTPPHFWAMALFAGEDFRRAKLPLLPLVAGEARARRGIALYAAFLLPAALALALSPAGGWVTLAVASIGGSLFLFAALCVWRRGEGQARSDRYRLERKLFGWSIFYLFALFSALIADALLQSGSVGGGIALWG